MLTCTDGKTDVENNTRLFDTCYKKLLNDSDGNEGSLYCMDIEK